MPTPDPSRPTVAATAANNILIVGATSGIAKAMARQLAGTARTAGRPLGLVLAGRERYEMDSIASDLRIRFGCPVATLAYDAAALDTAGALVRSATTALPGGLQGVVLAHGWLPDPEAARHDPAVSRRLIDVNYTSFALLLEAAADHLTAQHCGFICAISSVAGDRGRRSNYPYGAAKAGLTAYVSGLRSRLHSSGVHVLTVKPGFVDTAMTWGLLKPNSPLNASPERVAQDIVQALERRRDEIYTPWFWWGIMRVVKAIPESLFKRLRA